MCSNCPPSAPRALIVLIKCWTSVPCNEDIPDKGQFSLIIRNSKGRISVSEERGECSSSY